MISSSLRGRLLSLRRIVGGGVILLSGVFGNAHCSFLLDHDKAQCSADGDCTSRAGFEGTFCDLGTHVCASSDAYCTTNAQCIDRHLGADYVCHKDAHTCHEVKSLDCPTLYAEPGDLRNDDTVIIGGDLVPSFHQGTKAADHSLELARSEFKKVGFLPGVNGGARRPVAILSCDTPAPRSDAQIKETARHLVEDVRVSAIICPLESDRVSAMLQVTIPAKTPCISPIGNASTLDTVPNRENLFYQISPTDAFLLARGVHMVDRFFEPKFATATPAVPPPYKVAVMRDSTVAGSSAEKIYFDNALVNRKTLAANFTDGNYKVFDIGDPAADDFQTKVSTAVQQLTVFAPHFILVGGTVAGTASALALAEKNWTATYRPYWVANDTILYDPVINRVKADPGLRKRLAMIAFGPDAGDPVLVRYNLNYDGVFAADLEASRSILSAATYDATYLTFYALASLGNAPVTPEAVGRAYRNVSDPTGTNVVIGLDGINGALGSLGRGEKLHFTGTWGAPIFNAAGSNVAGETPVYCIEPTQSPAAIASGIKFDAAGALVLPTTSQCEF